jgi:hypothetical protein
LDLAKGVMTLNLSTTIQLRDDIEAALFEKKSTRKRTWLEERVSEA